MNIISDLQKTAIAEHLREHLEVLGYQNIRLEKDVDVTRYGDESPVYMLVQDDEWAGLLIAIETKSSLAETYCSTRLRILADCASLQNDDFWVAIEADEDEAISRLLLQHNISGRVWAVPDLG